MTNPLKKNFYTVFFGIFATVGTIMGIVAAGVWFYSNRLTRDGVRTTGTVVQLVGSQSRAPVVEFETTAGDRQVYTSSMYSSPPAYQVGETVTLWYAPEDPERVMLDGLERWLLPLIMGLFFAVFGGIGYGGLLYQRFKKADTVWLLQNGQPVAAIGTNVLWKTSVKLNNTSPFVIQCQWLDPATQKVYVFESDHLWYDPTPYLTDRPLQVLIDPHNPRKYHVDLAFLPEAG